MKRWLFSVRYTSEDARDGRRYAVVGAAQASTIEAVLNLAKVSKEVRTEIMANATVRNFAEGRVDHEGFGYYEPSPMKSSYHWLVCIGPVHEVLP